MNAPVLSRGSVRTSSQTKEQLLSHVRLQLSDALRLQAEGSAHATWARAQGAADGFMRALGLLGVCTDHELLEVVRTARRGARGPETAAFELESDSSARLL